MASFKATNLPQVVPTVSCTDLALNEQKCSTLLTSLSLSINWGNFTCLNLNINTMSYQWYRDKCTSCLELKIIQIRTDFW